MSQSEGVIDRVDGGDGYFLGEFNATLAVLEILIGYLREEHIAEMRDEQRVQWPEAFGFSYQGQASGSPEINPYLPPVRHGGIALPVLQILNALNRFCHELARRVLGHSLVVRLRDDFPPRSYSGDFSLLGNYTRTLTVTCRYIIEEPQSAARRLITALERTEGSLRCLQFKFANMSEVGEAFWMMLQCAPALEELGLVRIGATSTISLAQVLDGPSGWRAVTPDFHRSLRVVKLRHFELEHIPAGEIGLPSALSPLYACTALREVHMYRPFHRSSMPTRCFQDVIYKLSWTRRESKVDFISESVWLQLKKLDLDLPSEFISFMGKTHSLTLRISPGCASVGKPQFLTDLVSLRNLTILSRDFPSEDLLRGIPKSVEDLNIKFEVYSCQDDPEQLDDGLSHILERRAVKSIHMCLDPVKDFGAKFCEGNLFEKSDRALFVKTRALCARRGGQLLIENPLGVIDDDEFHRRKPCDS